MHRIDSAGAVAERFNDNLGVSNPATRVTAAWLNDIQENLCAVIEAAGIPLDKGNGGQLLAALLRFGHATGDVIQVYGTTARAGFLKLDGTPHLKSAYPGLVTYLTGQGLLVTDEDPLYFVLADARGYGTRNWDDGAGVDPGRGIATLQEDAFASHAHALPSNSANGTANGYVEDTDGGGTPRTAETGLTGTGTETRMKNIALMYLIKT